MDILLLLWLSVATVITPTPPVMLASTLIDIGVENQMGGTGVAPSAAVLLLATNDKLLLATGDKLLIN